MSDSSYFEASPILDARRRRRRSSVRERIRFLGRVTVPDLRTYPVGCARRARARCSAPPSGNTRKASYRISGLLAGGGLDLTTWAARRTVRLHVDKRHG